MKIYISWHSTSSRNVGGRLTVNQRCDFLWGWAGTIPGSHHVNLHVYYGRPIVSGGGAESTLIVVIRIKDEVMMKAEIEWLRISLCLCKRAKMVMFSTSQIAKKNWYIRYTILSRVFWSIEKLLKWKMKYFVCGCRFSVVWRSVISVFCQAVTGCCFVVWQATVKELLKRLKNYMRKEHIVEILKKIKFCEKRIVENWKNCMRRT